MGKLCAIWMLLVAALLPSGALAQDFGVAARALPEQSVLRDSWRGETQLRLELSAGVPWRAYTLTAPDRVVLDFREVDFSGLDLAAFDGSDAVSELAAGPLRAGWSRMVLVLAEPLAIAEAGLVTEPEGAALSLRLQPTDRASFDATAGAPASPDWQDAPLVLGTPETGESAFTIVIDPGHGGIDPGAIRAGYKEADLVLRLALALEEALIRSGADLRIILTRRSDDFVSLERRVAIAAQAGADAFVSLHADAIAEGRAEGASIFTLPDRASEAATAALVERHERGNLLAGVDLSRADDEVAQVLIDLARQDSRQRSQALARALKDGIVGAGVMMHKNPLQEAGFSVLKSADIPSVLVEAAFLSTDAELERLKDPAWRARIAGGLAEGVLSWATEDRAIAPLRRQ
ncbi:N-acetylmuramoyl-L-alanine amidase [Primorskyibacter sp. S187A]|uniref:N-acetylmuramoyl-L-alanine amidase n=1 Tax=Primorskyibacter sp. S187A TaxID=3415130 RepID=UPI003C7B9043